MKTLKEVIQSIFELREEGKVSVKMALEPWDGIGKSARRASPGKSKSNPNPVFKYYGMKLTLNQTDIVAPSLPESVKENMSELANASGD